MDEYILMAKEKHGYNMEQVRMQNHSLKEYPSTILARSLNYYTHEFLLSKRKSIENQMT